MSNTDSPELVLNGYQLTLDQVQRVAAQPGRYTYDLSTEARGRMTASVETLQKLIATGAAVYGVTTGFGASADHQVSTEKTLALQRNLLRFLRVGSGPYAPDEVVRVTMLIRANCAARGNSAIREEPIELLLSLLRHDIVPCIPERGSVGASGDLAPLSYLAAALTGEGIVRCDTEVISAASALARYGLNPVELQAKEGLALVNGTSFSAAYLALAYTKAHELIQVAELCTALATEVRCGPREPFAPFAHLHRPHLGQIASAESIYHWLDGSRLTISDADLAKGAAAARDGYVELDRHLQDPYSIRCAPHVIGVLRDTLRWTGEWLTTEINASTDNPLVDVDAGMLYNSGNFYGGHLAQAAQALSVAAAGVADLLDRQLQLIVDSRYSQGLPANLVASQQTETGLHHGFKGAQIAASALTAEALHLTMPVSSFSRSTESHNQDKVSMSTIAARHCRTVMELATEVAAVHLLALVQAADLRGADLLALETQRVYRAIRQHVPFVTVDRPLDNDIQRIVNLIGLGTFTSKR